MQCAQEAVRCAQEDCSVHKKQICVHKKKLSEANLVGGDHADKVHARRVDRRRRERVLTPGTWFRV